MTGNRVFEELPMQLTNVSIVSGCKDDSAGELCLDVMPPWSAQRDNWTRSEADDSKMFEETALACSFLPLLALSICGNIPTGSLSFYPTP